MKVTQSLQSTWSVCIQSLKPVFYPFSWGLIKEVKHTRKGNMLNSSSLNVISLYLNLSQMHLETRQGTKECFHMHILTFANVKTQKHKIKYHNKIEPRKTNEKKF